MPTLAALPAPSAPDREAAHTIVSHPEQGWSLLCNGVVIFEDTGELLPDGACIAPHRPTDLAAFDQPVGVAYGTAGRLSGLIRPRRLAGSPGCLSGDSLLTLLSPTLLSPSPPGRRGPVTTVGSHSVTAATIAAR